MRWRTAASFPSSMPKIGPQNGHVGRTVRGDRFAKTYDACDVLAGELAVVTLCKRGEVRRRCLQRGSRGPIASAIDTMT